MTKDEEELKGMTVNERLLHFGLLSSFDAAVRSQNLDAVTSILKAAKFSLSQAETTAAAVLANPKNYGY